MLIDGPVRVVGPDGYRLATRDVRVDLDKRTMQSRGPVSGSMELASSRPAASAPTSTSEPSAWRRRALENRTGGGQMIGHENQADHRLSPPLAAAMFGAGLAHGAGRGFGAEGP